MAIPLIEHTKRLATALGQCAAELVWPTRCAVCEKPGQLLCDRCLGKLGYVDPLRACPRCGAPYGSVQCSECNCSTLAHRGYERYPLDGQASAVVFDEAASLIVRAWKDGGERGLAPVMGQLMARSVPPSWLGEHPTVAAIPASERALRSRGFDHGSDLASSLARCLGLPCETLLDRPATKDQRELTGAQRAANMRGSLRVGKRSGAPASIPEAVLLADDVCTTGATLFAAAEALRDAGVQRVFAVTFARVW